MFTTLNRLRVSILLYHSKTTLFVKTQTKLTDFTNAINLYYNAILTLYKNDI